MGNVVNKLTNEKDTSAADTKDREYLELSCSTIYNEEYLSNIYQTLPNLDGIDDKEIKMVESKKSKLSSSNQSHSKTCHLISVFSTKPDYISIDNFLVRY